jgi:hypothetical protein
MVYRFWALRLFITLEMTKNETSNHLVKTEDDASTGTRPVRNALQRALTTIAPELGPGRFDRDYFGKMISSAILNIEDAPLLAKQWMSVVVMPEFLALDEKLKHFTGQSPYLMKVRVN